MPFLTPKEKLMGFELRKKLSGEAAQGAQIGEMQFGQNEFGGSNGVDDSLLPYGIYQMRHTNIGYVPIRMKFYAPSNPQTEAQQANRSAFADAVANWHNLTDEEKEIYNKRARGRGMYGFNLFIREHMLST